MMQQTQKYKLNKPGKDDTFSVDPLNENMDKLESALSSELGKLESALASETAARQTGSSGLEQRVVKLENCRIVTGWYEGTGGEKIIDLGERPAAVLVGNFVVGGLAMVAGDRVCVNTNNINVLKLVDNGFCVSNIFNVNTQKSYSFIAFLGGWPTREFPNEAT